MIPAVDMKEEEVNKLSCSAVGGWSGDHDGEYCKSKASFDAGTSY